VHAQRNPKRSPPVLAPTLLNSDALNGCISSSQLLSHADFLQQAGAQLSGLHLKGQFPPTCEVYKNTLIESTMLLLKHIEKVAAQSE
jgi:hypothetical protein